MFLNTTIMKKYTLEQLTKAALRLPEYQRKQLAIICMSSTVTEKSLNDCVDQIKFIQAKNNMQRILNKN